MPQQEVSANIRPYPDAVPMHAVTLAQGDTDQAEAREVRGDDELAHLSAKMASPETVALVRSMPAS